MFSQKDIVLIPFPYSNLTGVKQRPALVISNSKLHGVDRICCLITSNHTAEGLPLKKDSFASGRLPFESFVKPQRIFTIHEKIIIKKLCTITDDCYEKILSGILNYIKREI